MKFFSKKQEDIFDVIDDTPAFTIEPQSKKAAPMPVHMLTPEEILGNDTPENEAVDGSGALEALKKRLNAVAEGSSEELNSFIKQDEKAEQIISEKVSINEEVKPQSPKAEEVKTEAVKEPEPAIKSGRVSLLDKCQPYIIDDDGKEVNPNSKPLYELQSVAEILKTESEKTIERLSEKYDVSFDDLGHTPLYLKPEKKAQESVKTAVKPELTVKASTAEKEIFEEKLPVSGRVKNVQSNVAAVISDIDVPEPKVVQSEEKESAIASTITFTPVSDGGKSGSHITVSTQTRSIDLTGELMRIPDVISENNDEELKLQKNEFEEYAPNEEFCDEKETAKFVRRFSILKRRAFLQTVFSFLITAVLCIGKLPFMTEILLAHTAVGMTVCSALAGIAVLINCDMFASFAKIFSRRSTPDICAALAAVSTAVYAVFGIMDGSIITDMLLLLCGILSFRSLGKFFKTAHMLSNFRQISANSPKRAIKLINDHAITFSMAKNAIDGDVLIAAPQKCDHIGDYIRYTTFGSFIGGKLPIITVLSVLMSAIVGIACGFYFDGIAHGFYAAAAIQCFTALPPVFLIDNLPLYRTAKRLNRKGAMIAGKTGTAHIEMANAVVFNACDIFPSGTVTLHRMQVLSDNDLEDTLIRAASLCEALDSTLAPIFKKIAGTGNITVLPDSDTVKYEDTLGISGWVDNRLLFIGNRTLMESHGIEVPPLEIDRKILRQGYFPVYVATADKACALLMVQYNVDNEISHELRRLTALGVTVLINSSDPNLTEEMICDYMGLYDDSVKVMSSAGAHMYRVTVSAVKSASAPAAYKSNPIALASIINCASKIKKSNILLTALYIICVALGTVIFAYTSLGGSGSLISDTTLLLYGIICTVVSYIIYLTERP